jgi:hypothetical protein
MRSWLLFGLLVAACSKGPQADLASIGEARSLAAEWSLVNEQAAKGQITPVYAETMRERLREELQTDLRSLNQPQSRYGAEIRALLALPDDASPAILRAHARALKQVEDNLESA